MALRGFSDCRLDDARVYADAANQHVMKGPLEVQKLEAPNTP